jgi:predicted Zn finger-like uncharacterized protein
MSLEVSCPSCEGKFRVPDSAAGKKIRCPKCKGAIEVPAAEPEPQPESESEPQAVAPVTKATPKAAATKPTPAKPAAPVEQWFFKGEDGESYGPVPRKELDAWKAEGRVTADCQVLREGTTQWQWASDLYPDLETPEEEEVPPPEPEPTPAKKIVAKTSAKPAAAPKWQVPEPEEAEEGEPAQDEEEEEEEEETAPKAVKAVANKTSAKRKHSATRADDDDDTPESRSSRSKAIAGLLGIFLGPVGAHRFYLGYWGLGIAMLLTGGGCGLWSLVDGIFVLLGKIPDADGRPLSD